MELTKVRDLIQEQVKPKNFQIINVIKNVLSLIAGFLLIHPFVIGKLSPFAISFVCACDGLQSIMSCIGAVTGSIVFFDSTDAVKYVASTVLCVIIKILCTKYFKTENEIIVKYFNSFFSLFSIGTAIMLATKFNLELFVTITYEAVLSVLGTYIFCNAVDLIFSKKSIDKMTNGELIIILSAVCLIITPFYKYTFLYFSPLGSLFTLFILMCARLKNSVGGATAGICIGVSIGLGGEIGFMSAGYALSGLLSGEYSRNSRLLCTLGFLFPIIISAFIDKSIKGYVTIFEAVIGCVIFYLLPESLFEKISEKVNSAAPVYIKSDSSKILSKRLNDASNAIVQISDCVENVHKSLEPLEQDKLLLNVRAAWKKVCAECELCESCRKEIKKPSEATLSKIVYALKDGATLDKTKFPKDFPESCYCFDDMCKRMQNCYLSYLASVGAQGKVDQMQGLLSDQFKSMADILQEIACDFDDDLNINTEFTDICAQEAQEFGLNVLNVNSFFDKFERLSVTLEVGRPRENFNVSNFTESISLATGTRMDLPKLTDNGDTCIFSFSPKITFSVDAGAFSRSADDVQVCGDYYQSFYDTGNRFVTVLSDGMGTGNRAAVDSAMAAELFSKLVKSGLSFDCALPIANSALLIKSSDESLATLDVVCVDVYNGRTDFMKAGAAATFIRHKDSVASLEQASLPIGILRDIQFTKATAKLCSNDIILMVSDGILGECNGWIQHELKAWDCNKSAQELAKYIVDSACERKLGKTKDDMTAVVIYIKNV